jgi:solute carrier family 25 thiamine pyrophosphate transporter 19
MYQALNRRSGAEETTQDSLSQIQLFTCGLAAGTTGKICCHPLDVVKKRFQVRSMKSYMKFMLSFF